MAFDNSAVELAASQKLIKTIVDPHGAATSTAAILAGWLGDGNANATLDAFRDGPMADQLGVDSIYIELAHYGVLCHQVWEVVQAACECAGGPGVYDYEVAETFGAWHHNMSTLAQDMVSWDEGRRQMGVLAYKFFSTWWTEGDLHFSSTQAQLIRAAIEVTTGYKGD